jgi:hypothetical protein
VNKVDLLTQVWELEVERYYRACGEDPLEALIIKERVERLENRIAEMSRLRQGTTVGADELLFDSSLKGITLFVMWALSDEDKA